MTTMLEIIGAAALTVAVAVYLWFAVAVACGMLSTYRSDPWWENVLIGVLWPVIGCLALLHLDRESKGERT